MTITSLSTKESFMQRSLKWIRIILFLVSNRRKLLFNHSLFKGISETYFQQISMPFHEYQALANDLSTIAKYVIPHSTVGSNNLVRIGSINDGGYVLLDDLDFPTLSIGIGDDIEFDHAMCKKGSSVFQFDHTIIKPPKCCDKPIYFNLGLAGEPKFQNDKLITLREMVEKCQLKKKKNTAILKIDIEGGEWSALSNSDNIEVLGFFRQIVLECHNMEKLINDEFRKNVVKVLGNINKKFFVVNYHGNNFLPALYIAGLVIPQTFEITFVSRDIYTQGKEDFTLKSVNSPNNPHRREMFEHLSSLRNFSST